MKKNLTKRILLLTLVLALCVSLVPPVHAAGDAMDPEDVRELLNSVELHPQRTGYEEFDLMMEEILKPYEKSDNFTKIRAVYDWIVLNVGYSWEGYSQDWAPAYDCFTLTYDLTYEVGLQEAFPREIIDRSYHAISDRVGVCYDYAALFAVMARYVGFEAYVHTGYYVFEYWTAAPGSVGHHGWAEIKIGEENYIFDPQRDCRRYERLSDIPHEYFGISYDHAWRYDQETEENDARDAGFLPVTAKRKNVKNIEADASPSGTVTGGGVYEKGKPVTLTAQGDAPVFAWYDDQGRILSREETYAMAATESTTVFVLFLGDYFFMPWQAPWYEGHSLPPEAREAAMEQLSILVSSGGFGTAGGQVARYLAAAAAWTLLAAN